MTNTLEMFPTTINRCTPSERRTAASQGIAEKCDIDVVWTTYHKEKFVHLTLASLELHSSQGREHTMPRTYLLPTVACTRYHSAELEGAPSPHLQCQ